MQRFDVCNGDADGLCAAVQWRWHEPAQVQLVTGLKREIALLARVQTRAKAGDEVNVFDLSMQRNQPALRQMLDAGVRVRYVDHHATGSVPDHPLLQAHVDLGSTVCTSLLVDKLLNGAHRHWALVGAYGDDLRAIADELALASGLGEIERADLRRLGEGLNYNAYGESEADVHLPPVQVYDLLVRYRDPLDLLKQESIADQLDALRQSDLDCATRLAPMWQGAQGRVLRLPDAPWARRVIGVLANELARERPEQAHAVLRQLPGGGFSVSVRAPLMRPDGAAGLCQEFGGNGRARAAGIDNLPERDLTRFMDAFKLVSWGHAE